MHDILRKPAVPRHLELLARQHILSHDHSIPVSTIHLSGYHKHDKSIANVARLLFFQAVFDESCSRVRPCASSFQLS
jgi:hypothetical protein